MKRNGKKELAELRRRRIVDELRKRGAVRTLELAHFFSVSPMTIRNDLSVLAERGLLERVHGGAVFKGVLGLEPSYFEKGNLNIEEKQAIGKTAVTLIKDEMVLFIGNGTTTMQIIHALKKNTFKQLTIFTNAVTHALELADIPNIDVYVIGGYLRGVSYAMVGPLAHAALGCAYFDIAFLGSNGVSAKYGVTIPSLEEAYTASEVVRRAKKTVIVADHTKLGAAAHAKIADIKDVHILITDSKASVDDVKALRNLGLEVIIADEGG